MSSYLVVIKGRTGADLTVGVVNEYRRTGSSGEPANVYKFIPWTTAHQPSRKLWPTAESSIPRWIGSNYRLVEKAPKSPHLTREA